MGGGRAGDEKNISNMTEDIYPYRRSTESSVPYKSEKALLSTTNQG